MARSMERIEAGIALFAVVASATTIGRLRQGQSDVITGVLFLAMVGTWLVFLCRITLQRLPRVATLVPGVTALVATTTLMMILLELVLRWGVGTRATYAEQNGSAGDRRRERALDLAVLVFAAREERSADGAREGRRS